MPNAYAREPDDSHKEEIVLENKDLFIQKVHISGLNRTKSDFIVDDVKPIFNAKTFLDIYKQSLICKEKLLRRGIFRDVEILIDTCDAYENMSKDAAQVVLRVKEKSFVGGEVKTEMSNTEKPHWVMRLVSPNILGRGENFSASVSNSLSGDNGGHIYEPTDFQSSFTKPYKNSKVSISVLQEKQDCFWSNYDQTIKGIETAFSFPFLGNQHQLSWQGHWRELLCGNRNTSFDIRKEMGQSLKSSILHSMVIDKTNDSILPTKGVYFKAQEEISGLGGDVKYVKEIVEANVYATVLKHVTFGLGVRSGFMVNYGDDLKSRINDRFFIGGPLTLRGFGFNQVGKENGENNLGSNAFWLFGAHIYTPLPFYWSTLGSGSWIDNIRTHLFFNAGNLFDINKDVGLKENFNLSKKNIRLSCGIGLVYRFMNSARFELNFCYPIKAQSSDKLCDGVQFGIGISSV